ncbi:tetratricopeptide repeat protein [candidate division KSB1 bacterium]
MAILRPFRNLIFIITAVILCAAADVSAYFQDTVIDSTVLIQELKIKEQMRHDPEYKRLKRILRNDSANLEVLNNLGYVLIKYTYLDSAEKIFKYSLSIDPEQASPNNGKGLIFLKKGRSSVIIFEALKKALNKDNYTKAINEFNRALSIDPDFHQARYNLARAYLAKEGDGDFRRGIEIINELIERAGEYPGAYYMLGRFSFELEDYDSAEDMLVRELSLDERNGTAFYYLGLTYYRKDIPQKATDNYLNGIELINDSEILEDIYIDLHYLFTREQNRAYLNLPLDQRGRFIAQFWRDIDPNILSLANERLIEHLERVDHAKAVFEENNFRGYDDRGMIWIKFGKPSGRRVDIARSDNAADNESWLYSNIDKNMGFDFVSTGALYRLVPDLSYASRPRSNATARKLYFERLELGGVYAEIGGKSSIVNDNITADLALFNIHKDEAIDKAPPQHFDNRISAIPINFPMILTQFRGDDGNTSVELYYGVPLDQLTFEETGENTISAEYETHLVILDSMKTRIDELSRPNTLNAVATNSLRAQFYIGSELFEIASGKYTFGFELKQDDPLRMGLYQFEIPVKDFSSRELAISDLRVSSSNMAEEPRVVESREELSLRPYPFSSIRTAQPLLLYFEIYNLMLDPQGRSSYTIEYTIRKDQQKSGFLTKVGRFLTRSSNELISFTQERNGDKRTSFELMNIDISRIKPSDAIISVTVTDNNIGEVVFSTRGIRILE